MIRTSQPTRICRTLIDHGTEAVTELVEEGLMPGACAWTRFYRSVRRNIAATRMMVIAGALMPGAEPAVYGRLAASGVPFLIDSRREPLMATLPYHPFIAKLNVHELEDTIGRRCATERAVLAGAKCILDGGAQHVVVTHGAHGAWLIGSEGAWHYRPPRLNAVNPIGSGDAFTAGICRGLERGQSPIDAVRLGVACGAANALTLLAGHVIPADVERLLRLVRTHRVQTKAKSTTLAPRRSAECRGL
jgi:fructose-1-phosphate kinase PfkB-like protein